MSKEEPLIDSEDVKKIAWHPIVVLSGSLMMLSVTANNIGFGKVVDAYADRMVAEIEYKKTAQENIQRLPPQQCIMPTGLMGRLESLEELSHKSGKKH